MTRSTCNGCTYLRDSLSYDDKACYRAKSFIGGRVNHAPHNVGFPRRFETKRRHGYDDRLAGDICGPDRIHWRAK